MRTYLYLFRFWYYTLLLSALLRPLGGRAQAGTCLLVPVALGQRVRAAALVVEARVRSQQAEAAGGGHLVTRHRLEVYKVFKGQLPAGGLSVLTLGGTLGLRRETVSGTLQLRPDEQGIFLLEADPAHPGELRAYAGPQGFIAYHLAGLTASEPFGQYPSIGGLGQAVAAASAPYHEVLANAGLLAATRRAAARPAATPLGGPAPTISSFSPASLTAGTSTSTTSSTVALTITGVGFGAVRDTGYVQFRNADTPGPDGSPNYTRPLASDYLSWTDTQIQVRVPSDSQTGNTAGTGLFQVANAGGGLATSPGVLTVTYALITLNTDGRTYRPHLVSLEGSGGYTLHYSPSFGAAAQAPFERALRSWHHQTSMNRPIGAPTTIDEAANDSVNVVRFAADRELPEGVLGITYAYYSGCARNGEPLNWQVVETDYVYIAVPFAATSTSPAYTWNFGPDAPTPSQYDFQSVALHELGHGEQLAHIISATGVMNYALANGETRRDLDPGTDVAGGQDVVSYSTGLSSDARCDIAAFAPSTSDGSLPVVLTAFGATYRAGQGTHLSWATASEQHSLAFSIESQPATASAWQEVARVAAAGSSPTPLAYAYLDARPLAGTRYYRLRQLDQDGTATYSPVVAVRAAGAAAPAALSAYPTPATGLVHLSGPLAAGTAARVRLLDATGRCVARADGPAGQAAFDLPLARVPAGLYVLEWDGGAGVHRQRLVVAP